MIMRHVLGAGAIALPAVFLPLTWPTTTYDTRTRSVAFAPEGRTGFAEVPPAPWGEAGPADSLYRLGREAINRNDFRRAAALFAEISAKYPRSEYAPDAPYWRAFALYKAGREDDLREALKALDMQQSRFPKAATIADGKALSIRIRGQLAQQGDVNAAEDVTKAATQNQPCVRNDADNDIRAAAMNALLQMDAEGALPIIKQVLARRDECNISLREKAVFLLSQKRSPESETLLIETMRNDPARSVREQAGFWPGQVRTEGAAAALEQVATSSPDTDMRAKAIHALKENGSPRAMALLRRLAESAQTPESVREQAIFWLGQGRSSENADFLRGLFSRLGSSGRNDDLRKKVLFSLSQMRGVGNDRWLLAIALDTSYSEDVRGHALWTAGQAGIAGSQLVSLYDKLTDRELKEKLIWVMSESKDSQATDKLIEIAEKDRDREMRKKALFWLGQKNDPRVQKILMDILTKP